MLGGLARVTQLTPKLYAITLTLVLAMALPSAAQNREAAANAFDRGSAAYLEGDYAAAARWFEMANTHAPAAPALLQAIRAHVRAENILRAATLSLRLVSTWPDAEAEVAAAQEIIDQGRERYFFVEVTCDAECSVEVNQTLQAHPSFFLEPDRGVTVGAAFDSGTVTDQVSGAAGESRSVHFERPEGPALETQTETGTGSQTEVGIGTGTETTTGNQDDESSGMSPVVFFTGLALTVGAGAVLAWSGVDTLNTRDDYEAAAAEERAAGNLAFPRASALLDDGEKAERRTNALIGVTAGLGAITLLTAIFTDWGGSDNDDEDTSVRVGIGPGSASIGGQF